MRVVFGLAVAFLAYPAIASAQMSEAQQREACTGDVMQYCGAFIPDRAQIAQCLRRSPISAACRTAMGGGAKAPAKKTARRSRRTTQ